MAGRVTLKIAALALLSASALGLAGVAFASGGEGGGMGVSPPSSMPNVSGSHDPAWEYQAGVQALQAHQYQEAVTHLRYAQRGMRSDPNVNFALGLAYVGQNDNNHAREALERAVHAPNAPVGAYLQLGLVYLQLNQRDQAVAQQTALQNMLNACDAACGDARRAQIQAQLDALTQALNAPPQAAAPTTGWNFPSVEEGRRAYADAVGLINTQHYSEALIALDRAQAAIGPQPDILNYKGFASRRLGRLDDALTYYRAALALDPNHRGANEYLGELYLQMGRVADARRQLARLDYICAYGCSEREELAQQIASNGTAQ